MSIQLANSIKITLKRIFIDNADKENSDFLTGVGYEVHYSNLVMNNTLSKNKLAENIIKVLEAK